MLSRGAAQKSLLLGAALATVITGCTSSTGGAAGSQPSPSLSGEETLRSAELSFPLDEFDFSEREGALLLRAQAVLVEECMARFSFDYDHPQLAQPMELTPVDRRYGLSDPDYAAEYGYGWPEALDLPDESEGEPRHSAAHLGLTAVVVLLGEQRTEPSALPDNLADAEAQLAADPEAMVIEGQRVPYGGCVRESALRLYAPQPGAIEPEWVRGLAIDAYLAAEETPAVREVTGEWVSCMAEYGYQVTDPVSPAVEMGLPRDELTGHSAREAATRDVLCKQRTGLVGTWYQAERDSQQRLVEQHTAELQDFKSQREERLRLAEDILAGSHRQ